MSAELETQEIRTRFADHSRHLTGIGTATFEARFDRWHAEEKRIAEATGLRRAAEVLYSERAEQWRQDAKGALGAQMIAQHLGLLADILARRADDIDAPDE